LALHTYILTERNIDVVGETDREAQESVNDTWSRKPDHQYDLQLGCTVRGFTSQNTLYSAM